MITKSSFQRLSALLLASALTPAFSNAGLAADRSAPDPSAPAAAVETDSIPQVRPESTASKFNSTPAPAHGAPGPPAELQPYNPMARRSSIPAPGPQASEPVTTLRDAIALAYRFNPRLLAQRATVRSTDEQYPEARAAYGPTISATISHVFTRDSYQGLGISASPAEGWATTPTLTATEPLLTFGRNKASEAGALAQIAYQRNVLSSTESQVLLAVVTDYISVLRDAKAVSIARQNVAILRQQYTDDTQRSKSHEITVTDLQQDESRLEFQTGQQLQAEGQLASDQGQFLHDVGAPAGDLAPPDPLALPVQSLDDAYAVADAESPALLSAQAQERVSRAALNAARAELAPRVDLEAQVSTSSLSLYNQSPRLLRAQGIATLTVPIFASGLRMSRIGAAHEADEAAWEQIDAAERDVRASVNDAWAQYASSKASIAHYSESVQSASEALTGARLQLKAGDRTTIELLDMARDLLTAENNLNIASANEYLARASLLSAIGRLKATDLVAGIDAYDPTDHFKRVKSHGDIPVLTPIASTVDGLLQPDTSRDRPIRDPTARVTVEPTVAEPTQ